MNNKISDQICPICSNNMHNRICSWTYYCDSCGYWAASLQPNINSQSDYIFSEERDDSGIISFLDSIRIINFNKILNYIPDSRNRSKLSILDIGCASGLFLNIAEKQGYTAIGIEPNPIMANKASENGFNVVNGYFPSALNPTSKFDIIIFNDVFEHIPDINETLQYCKNFLNDDGMLIMNLPNSGGIFFRLAKMLACLGFSGPWNRLWQVMFYTPHLHYFNTKSLDKLLKKYNFENKSTAIELEAVNLNGLWKRLSVDKSNNLLVKILLYAGIILFYPIIMILEKDAFFSIYKQQSKMYELVENES
jgi:2-polyprenyl-3-methyl-5-hydroxy-6-metoxy-1,4-benzoquinol methylase